MSPRLRCLVALVAFAVPLFFVGIGSRALVTNDEARFPLMARDILDHGNWLAPELAGEPMLNKPPLHAWLIALASLPSGAVTPRTAAIPSALAALALVLCTAWFGARLFGLGVGTIAGFILATMVGAFSLARAPLPDMTLTLATTAAMVVFAVAESDGHPGARVAFFGLTGLAFLAKGPAGLMPLAAALVYAVRADGPRPLRRLLSPAGLALLAVLVVPWSLLALDVGARGFVRDVVVTDMLVGYLGLHGWRWTRLTDTVAQPLAVLSPWSTVLPFVCWSAIRRPESPRKPGTWLACAWAGAFFLLLAASARQRFRYYLPLCPPVAILIAAWYCRLHLRHSTAVFACATAAIALALTAAERHEVRRRDRTTDLRALTREIGAAPRPTFALDSPEIVFSFYLNRPVAIVASPAEFLRIAGPAYLITSERQALLVPHAAARLAVARVDGHPFVVLRKD